MGYPLIIDPGATATVWLVRHLQQQREAVEVTTPGDPKFFTQLELAVRFGKTIVIREVDRVEPMLVPIIRREVRWQGIRAAIQVGDKLVDYGPDFQLYFVTRSAAVSVAPDVAPYMSSVNFSVTFSGLESQLLGLTMQRELPEVEARGRELLQKVRAQLPNHAVCLVDTRRIVPVGISSH